VLAHAQASGAKDQQDAQLGQGSFFDLQVAEAAEGGHRDLPVPPLPDEREQLNAWEKETLGLFLSSHPLKELRPALRARVECSLADLAERRDGDWVTVGGMIVECKRIRTKKGDPMMFATLDDLEGQVEMLVFNSAYAQNADKVATDEVVVVRGRVDHKEAGETKLVAQEIQPFAPTPEELVQATSVATEGEAGRRLVLQVSPDVPDSFLEELRDVVRSFPGEHELLLSVGNRRLLLGPGFRVSADGACRAELSALHGATRIG
jgi:DNA polymerase III subunit alpha